MLLQAALCLASTLLFALIWPPFGWWWLAFIAIAPLTIAVLQPTPLTKTAWRTFCLAFFTQWPAWIFVEWWLVQLTPPGMVGLALYCTFYTALYAVMIRAIGRAHLPKALPMTVLVPLVWTACEFLRTSVVLGGYPWYHLGVPLAGAADGSGIWAQSASLFGTTWLSTLAAAGSGVVVDWWRAGRPAAPANARRTALIATACVMLVLGVHVLFGSVVGRGTLTQGPTILAVQTNLSTSNKIRWEQNEQLRDVTTFLQMSAEGFTEASRAGTPPDLVVWPETMVPGFGLEPATIATLLAGPYYPGAIYADALASLHHRLGVPLLVGSSVYLGLRVNEPDDRWLWDRHHNSAYLVTGEPPYPRYDKLKLTPYGEEMPLVSRWDWLEEQMLAFGAPGMTFDLDAGERIVRFNVPYGAGQHARIVTPICFEDTVGWLCRDLCYERGRKVADLMVNLSNDGWFGWSDTGREHHLLHARLRSIELAVPMLRCANTGLSVLIDDRGRVVTWLPGPANKPAPGQSTIAGTLRAVPQCTDRVTLYGRFGDVWAWIALLATGIMTVVAVRHRAHERSPPQLN